MDTIETYNCDCCGKTFKIEAIVTFRTEKTENDFDSSIFSTKIKNNR